MWDNASAKNYRHTAPQTANTQPSKPHRPHYHPNLTIQKPQVPAHDMDLVEGDEQPQLPLQELQATDPTAVLVEGGELQVKAAAAEVTPETPNNPSTSEKYLKVKVKDCHIFSLSYQIFNS